MGRALLPATPAAAAPGGARAYHRAQPAADARVAHALEADALPRRGGRAGLQHARGGGLVRRLRARGARRAQGSRTDEGAGRRPGRVGAAHERGAARQPLHDRGDEVAAVLSSDKIQRERWRLRPMAQRTRSDSTPAPAGPTREGAPSRPTFFLRTKLLPPRPASVLLSRPRLTERLQANLSHPVTLVTAPAGSGKTTLVADFVRAHARRFVWYQLDRGDADPLVFLEYLAHGVRQTVPGFGDVTLSYLRQSADEIARSPARAVDVLLNEVLREVSQQLVVVLDDYHHLGRETAVHAALDRLISYLPDVLHVIVVSRDVPPLALSRLRSQDSLAIIDRQELLFTDEETRELFRQVFDLELSPEQLTEYRERTQGWITALQLVRQFAQRDAVPAAAGAADLREILRRSEHDIFDYFAEEVFADESEDAQRFLLRISLLDRIELDACTRLYPEVDGRHVLPELVRRNVFMTVASDSRGEEYRLHPLFRSFLQRRFSHEAGREGVAAEHARCADCYLERGEWEHAARHLIASEDFGRAAAVVAERGGHWIAAGALASLTSLVEALPAEALSAHPRARSTGARRCCCASRTTARARPRRCARSPPSSAATATLRRRSLTSTAPP